MTKIKQPEPAFVDSKGKRAYNFPKIGVLKTPNISNTPILDEYIKRRNESPRQVYKETYKKDGFFDFQNSISALIVILGGVSFISAIKSVLKNLSK